MTFWSEGVCYADGRGAGGECRENGWESLNEGRRYGHGGK